MDILELILYPLPTLLNLSSSNTAIQVLPVKLRSSMNNTFSINIFLIWFQSLFYILAMLIHNILVLVRVMDFILIFQRFFLFLIPKKRANGVPLPWQNFYFSVNF